jgi:hypothetical protein
MPVRKNAATQNIIEGSKGLWHRDTDPDGTTVRGHSPLLSFGSFDHRYRLGLSVDSTFRYWSASLI